MNKLQALTIKTRSWMNPETHSAEILKYGIEYPADNNYVGSDKYNNYQVIWCESYDMDLIKLILNHEDPADILANFKAYFDNGTEEILINETNYKDYLNNINDWYLTRLGKYDIKEDII